MLQFAPVLRILLGCLENKDPKDPQRHPKTQKRDNEDAPYFGGSEILTSLVANAIES